MKRLIVCCDGTWNTPESTTPSNVLKVARAILPQSADGTPQVVFYDWGVGTHDKIDSIKGGAFGDGIDRNIQDAYRFLVHNYVPGDQIWFFGFSRGAYTARSCIGLIRNAWLLHKIHSHLIPEAYHIYRTQWGPDASNAVNFRTPHCHQVDIKFLGVWDTVGSLGIPVGLFKGHNRRYEFHDTSISSIIHNAYQALAIDERRKPFAPTIWKSDTSRTRTEQCWFAGVHSDVGGGYAETGLSDIALRWMVSKAAANGLALDQAYLKQLCEVNPAEVLHDSFSGPMKLLGSERRVIGATNHDETLHSSAEQRYQHHPKYRPANLKAWLEKDEQMQLPI